GAGGGHLGPRVGWAEATLAERPRRHERSPALRADRSEDALVAESLEEPTDRPTRIPRVFDVQPRLDRTRRAAKRRTGKRRGTRVGGRRRHLVPRRCGFARCGRGPPPGGPPAHHRPHLPE